MILVYYDTSTFKKSINIVEFDYKKELGRNKCGFILVGLYVFDQLEHKIMSFDSGSRYLLDVYLRYKLKEYKE